MVRKHEQNASHITVQAYLRNIINMNINLISFEFLHLRLLHCKDANIHSKNKQIKKIQV